MLISSYWLLTQSVAVVAKRLAGLNPILRRTL